MKTVLTREMKELIKSVKTIVDNNKIVIFDIDGTLSDPSHRIHFITQQNPKDWDSFYNECEKDSPIYPIIRIAQLFNSFGFPIYLFTGRDIITKEKTEKWLLNNKIYYDLLKMRPHGNYRPDHELKLEWFNELRLKPKDILCVFEDRSRVVKEWRDLGIICLQVADGDF